MKIAYKIFMPLLCLATLPILIFVPLLHLNITSTIINVSSLTGLKEYMSLYDFYQMARLESDGTRKLMVQALLNSIKDKDSAIGSLIAPYMKYVYMFLIFAGIMLVCILAVAVLSVVLKGQRITTCLSFVALASAFAMNKSFDAFADPFLTGKISLTSLVSGMSSFADLAESIGSILTALGSSLSKLVNSVIRVQAFELSVAYDLTFMLLLVAFIFSLVVLIMRRSGNES